MSTVNPGLAIEVNKLGRADSEGTLDDGRRVEAVHEEPELAGDKLDELSRKYADLLNQRETLTLLRERKMTVEQYRTFITEVYPIVVHFNYTLRSELNKLTEELDHPDLQRLATEALAADHVRDSARVQEIAKEIRRTVRQIATKPDEVTGHPRIDEGIYNAHSRLVAMAGQLHEEQEHNDLFRLMLEEHQIDHEQYHAGFEQYLNSLAPEDKYAYTAQKYWQTYAMGKNHKPFPIPIYRSQYLRCITIFLLLLTIHRFPTLPHMQ